MQEEDVLRRVIRELEQGKAGAEQYILTGRAEGIENYYKIVGRLEGISLAIASMKQAIAKAEEESSE